MKPTESELEILQLLWEHGPQPVRVINEMINKKREVGYTTTLKIMQLMNEKGLTIRDTTSRTHVYSANIDEQKTRSTLLSEFINTTFRGSAQSLVLQALGSSKTSQAELDEIKQLINRMENAKNEEL